MVSYLFEEIEKNLKFYVERRETHAKIITDIITTVRKMTVYKVMIIILLSAMQIYFIRKFFSNKKVDLNIYSSTNPFSDDGII